MAGRTEPSEYFREGWKFYSNDNGTFSNDTVAAASGVEAARRLFYIETVLRAILSQLDALGTDGLHYILRNEAAKRRKAERAAREERRKARLAAKAAAQ